MGRPGTTISIITPDQLFIMDKFQKQLGIRLQQVVMQYGKLADASEVKNSGNSRPSARNAEAPITSAKSPKPERERDNGGGRQAALDEMVAGAAGARKEKKQAQERKTASGSSVPGKGAGHSAAAKPQAKAKTSAKVSKAVRERERKDKGALNGSRPNAAAGSILVMIAYSDK